MKSYAGNWQINRNSRNRMSEKILSERIPLNGQWNNRTSPTWPEARHGREGKSRTNIFFTKLTKSNDRAILDNRSWNPRVFIGPAVILPDCNTYNLMKNTKILGNPPHKWDFLCQQGTILSLRGGNRYINLPKMVFGTSWF
jgi:hypothetical protein